MSDPSTASTKRKKTAEVSTDFAESPATFSLVIHDTGANDISYYIVPNTVIEERLRKLLEELHEFDHRAWKDIKARDDKKWEEMKNTPKYKSLLDQTTGAPYNIEEFDGDCVHSAMTRFSTSYSIYTSKACRNGPYSKITNIYHVHEELAVYDEDGDEEAADCFKDRKEGEEKSEDDFTSGKQGLIRS